MWSEHNYHISTVISTSAPQNGMCHWWFEYLNDRISKGSKKD